MSATERGGGVDDADATERELGARELRAGGERRRRTAGVDRGERLLGRIELAHEELAASADEAGVDRVRAIAERVERARGRVEGALQPPRSRAASATSASATWQRAWASRSRAPNPRAARRRSLRARSYSPSCAIAMPRSASAGGSSRSATRFNAPIGSPAASARAAAATRESSRGRRGARRAYPP